MRGLQVVRKVADGSAVEAFLASSSSGQVLVQVSRPELSRDAELYGRFLDTTNQSTGRSHPAVLSAREAHCASDGRFILTSGPVSGYTAEDWLRDRGPLSSDQGVEWGLVLCEALEFLHAHGVVHGNLSPRNVFLEGEGDSPEVRLLDTGLLLFRGTRSLNTPSSLVLVPPEYLSPERVSGKRGTASSDIYGLGVLLFQLLTRLPPFVGVTSDETRSRHLFNAMPQLPEHLWGWRDLLGRLLAKEPENRFATVLEVRQALLEIDDGVPVVLVPDSSHPTASEEITAEVVPQAMLPAASLDPGPGEMLGPYQLEQTIGEGGMGKVYLATHRTLGRKVAIKVLRAELASRPDEVRRFVQEARAVNHVNHPHIVQVHDLIEEPGRVYFVMELLEGRSVKDLGRERPIELARAVRWLRQAAEALDAAHRVGVVHRDVKPDNLFVTVDVAGQEMVKVLDFGVAQIRAWNPLSRVTQVGQVVGTPLWMAPEQVMGRDVDPSADVYALASVLYVLLTRKFPFEGTMLREIVMARLSREASPLPGQSFLGETIPSRLRELVGRGLSRDTQRRPTMRRFAEVLRKLEDETVSPELRPWWKIW